MRQVTTAMLQKATSTTKAIRAMRQKSHCNVDKLLRKKEVYRRYMTNYRNVFKQNVAMRIIMTGTS